MFDGAPDVCELTCLTCQICGEPDDIEDIDVIAQYVEVVQDRFSIFLKVSSGTVTGIQATVVCESQGMTGSAEREY